MCSITYASPEETAVLRPESVSALFTIFRYLDLADSISADTSAFLLCLFGVFAYLQRNLIVIRLSKAFQMDLCCLSPYMPTHSPQQIQKENCQKIKWFVVVQFNLRIENIWT